jgi:hypothetical protein
MVISLKRMSVVVTMALVLLAGLLGWSMKAMTGSLTGSYHGPVSYPYTHCPPPPRDCW